MRPTLVLLLLLFTALLHGQDYLIITGKVLDADNGKPLGYAHVGIPEKGIGTATGLDGDFTLKVPSQYAQSTLMVSYVGYATYRKSISLIQSPAIIKVKASPTNLQEVIVMDEAGVENIIRRAVRAIPKNYPTHPTTNLGFYRESKTDENEDYMYLAEGVLNIYKTSYRNAKDGQVSLVQGRKVILQPEEVAQSIGFTSGHLAADRFDFVKNREDFIDEKYFDDYQYWIEKITVYQDHPVYVIGFDKAENGHGRMKGEVFIDTLSYAFLRAEFEIRPEAQRKADDYPLYVGSWQANHYTVNYRQLDGKWYFSDALREGTYRDGGIYSNEIIITQINPEHSTPLPYLDRLGRNDAFLKSTGTYDEDFWKQYNTSPLSQKLAESIQQAKNDEKAAQVFDSTFMAEMQHLEDSIKEVKSQAQPDETFDFERDINPVKENKRNRWHWQAAFGAGTHLLETKASNMTLSYLDAGDGSTIVSTSDQLAVRALEPIYHLDLQVLFRKNFFFTWNISRDLWDSYYHERGLGFGAQVNISKRRPLFLRGSVQESRLRYARLVGAADNDYGTFKAGKKNFKATQVNMFYGSQTHNLKLTLEMALELNPSRELFVRGGYMLPFAAQQRLYLKERHRFFNKKALLPLSNQTVVEKDGVPFDDSIIPNGSLFFTVGLIFK